MHVAETAHVPRVALSADARYQWEAGRSEVQSKRNLVWTVGVTLGWWWRGAWVGRPMRTSNDVIKWSILHIGHIDDTTAERNYRVRLCIGVRGSAADEADAADAVLVLLYRLMNATCRLVACFHLVRSCRRVPCFRRPRRLTWSVLWWRRSRRSVAVLRSAD